MDENVFELWLDLVPGEGGFGEIGDGALERRAIGAGDVQSCRTPQPLRRRDLPQAAGGSVDLAAGRLDR